MNSDTKTRPADSQANKDAKAPAQNANQNLAFGLFGRRVSAPPEPTAEDDPSPVVDRAA